VKLLLIRNADAKPADLREIRRDGIWDRHAGNTNLWSGVKNAQSDDLRLAGGVAPDAPPPTNSLKSWKTRCDARKCGKIRADEV